MTKPTNRRLLPTLLIVLVSIVGAVALFFITTKTPTTATKAIQPQSQITAAKLDGTAYKTYAKPADEQVQKLLTNEQYDVTQHEGTERPYKNIYWDNKQEGIYVDVLSGEPLFSSVDKYDSGTGWPSFTQSIEPANIVFKTDRSLYGTRVEVRSKYGDNHLGHIFDDGPTNAAEAGHAKPTGKRYCMNSAALQFVAKADMEQSGYGNYLSLFN